MKAKIKVALVGGGPSALFVYKRLVERGRDDIVVEIFERKDSLGQGMPYSLEGANLEHITNVSSNELPDLVVPLADWVRALPRETLDHYGLRADSFGQSKVLPRLLFGQYLQAQFEALTDQASAIGLETAVHFGSVVTDIRDEPDRGQVAVQVDGAYDRVFDRVVICTGHNWPKTRENDVPGYYDSPYPPAKLARTHNHPVALRGSSLTAIDAIRTLARANGSFHRRSPHGLVYRAADGSEDFKIVMHSRSGLLPCVRFHLDDPQVSDDGLLGRQDLQRARRENGGFVPLDLIFEQDFKKPLEGKDPELYQRIKTMSLEQFVEAAMERRENSDPFALFKAECDEAIASLARKESIAWKEALAILSYALNSPAKHFCAEDMLRLKSVLMPLISIVIALVPQGSSEELIALHEAGRLELVTVGSESKVNIGAAGEIEYSYGESSRTFETFVDCVGQPHLNLDAFPFPSLVRQKVVRQARLTFRSAESALRHREKDPQSVQQDDDGSFHLLVPGLSINDSFQPEDWRRRPHRRIFVMAVPYIGGHNPDYSGLDFCADASARIVEALSAQDS
jgi:uncharacterized NAD(P)/FAD-binding protein YdhS